MNMWFQNVSDERMVDGKIAKWIREQHKDSWNNPDKHRNEFIKVTFQVIQ